MKTAFRLTPVLFLATAAAVMAHPGHGAQSGIVAGIAHPLSGWDHILAMVAVGLWAAQLRSPLVVPAAFLGMMAVGGVLGQLAGTLPGIDQGIAVTVMLLGLLLARSVRLPVAYAAALVGLFALFHGYAHGAEMPATAGGLAYGAGFMVATALLHAAGLGLGYLALRRDSRLPKAAGWAIAAAGVVIAIC